jgi:TIR domain
MAFDVFISYPHQDKAMADAACAKLEAEGIRCWIAPRDIAPSADWAASIVGAIDSCRVMVLIFSGHTNRSRQVSREVQQAFDGEKTVVPFRIENVNPEKSLRYYMGSVHWLDALTPPVEQHLQKLASAVQAILKATPREADAELTRAEGESTSRPATRWIRKVTVISGLFIISLGAISYHVWLSPLMSAKSPLASGTLQMPPGSYAHSCDSCSFDGRFLSCRCRTSAGQWLNSSMDWGGTCSSEVSNFEGRLVCAK